MSENPYSDELTRERLLECLGPLGHGLSVSVHRQIDSTNTEAKRMACADPDARALIVAEEQSAGRGRMGRSFYSPLDRGVYFSLLFPVAGRMQNAVSLTCAASVAVMRALNALTGKQTGIKWVNDLYYNEKKVCGILCEAVTVGEKQSLVIGIGINLWGDVFPEEIATVAGSLGVKTPLRAALIARVCRELMPYIDDPTDHSWLTDYRRCSIVLGKRVSWTRESVTKTGTALSIDEDGALLVRTDVGETERLSTGEISLRTRS